MHNGGITCAVGSVSFAYTAGGRKLSQTDAAGNATVIHYANDGTMLSHAVDAGGITEQRFEYDPTYPVMTVRERGPKNDPIRTEYQLERISPGSRGHAAPQDRRDGMRRLHLRRLWPPPQRDVPAWWKAGIPPRLDV